MDARTADEPEDRHLAYLRRLLESASSPGGGAEFLYLTRTEGKPGMWELVGFRTVGLSRAVIGAIHFQSQTEAHAVFARRSLGHYLSAPPQEIGFDRETYPPGLIPVRSPSAGESIPDLLGRLKRGEPTAPLFVDADHVEVAFDFRPANPSLQRPAGEQARARRLVFRTRDGHVLTGTTQNLGAKLRRASVFLALTEVRQHLPGHVLDLPTLVVNRGFLTMMSELSEGDLDAGSLPAAFSAETANPFHLLDPRLGTGAEGVSAAPA